ncbi:MAG: DUF4440 domain-containing protein [Actinomycetota bacterium]
MDWRAEIVELHEFFERWFRHGVGDTGRFESTMDPAFTIIPPQGSVLLRSEIVEAVRSGAGRSPDLRIETTDHALVSDDGSTLVARYVEHHHLERPPKRGPNDAERQEQQHDGSTARWSTVVFRHDATCPNGLRWLTVHETWATVHGNPT